MTIPICHKNHRYIFLTLFIQISPIKNISVSKAGRHFTGSDILSGINSPLQIVQVLLLFEKSLSQDLVLFISTHPSAHRLERHRHLEAFLYVVARIFAALRADADPLLGATFYDFVPAPILGLASFAGDLLVGDHMVPVADLQPKFRRAMQFLPGLLIWVLNIPRTD